MPRPHHRPAADAAGYHDQTQVLEAGEVAVPGIGDAHTMTPTLTAHRHRAGVPVLEHYAVEIDANLRRFAIAPYVMPVRPPPDGW